MPRLSTSFWTFSAQRPQLILFNHVYGRRFPSGVREIASSRKTSALRGGRKAGKTTVLDMSDLPQGLIPLEQLEQVSTVEEAIESTGNYPTVLQQAKNNMEKFRHCVVLTRVGGFYELYFEHAEKYGPLLNLKVGSKKTTAGPVAMAGFPFFQLDRVLKSLVQDLGQYVAISEETANDPSQRVKSGGLLFDREVKRIITPGTLIDEHFLSPFEHNYLLAIYLENHEQSHGGQLEHNSAKLESHSPSPKVGLAWLDLSSGDFFTQSLDAEGLTTALARIGPREIIIDKSLEGVSEPSLFPIMSESGLITYHNPSLQYMKIEDWAPMLEGSVSPDLMQAFAAEEIASSNLLLDYVKTQLPGLKVRLQAPVRQKSEDFMVIDKHSLRGLEVTQTLRDDLFKGSLLQAIRRTSTESGARLLTSRLTSPSMGLHEINGRLDLVEEFLHNPFLVDQMTSLLRRTSDTLRLVQKFSFGRGDADDLLGLSRTISITRAVGQAIDSFACLRKTCLSALVDRFRWTGPAQLSQRIAEAIDQEGLMLRQRNAELHAAEAAGMALDVLQDEVVDDDMIDLQKRLNTKRKSISTELETNDDEDIWIMRSTASETLKSLHDKLLEYKKEKAGLTTTLRNTLSATSLTLRHTPGLGHICHMKGKDTRRDMSVLEDARIVSTSKSTRSFYLSAWTSLGTRIEDAKVRIRAEEQRVLQSLREEVIENIVVLRRNAAVLDEIDVSCSFAKLAQEFNLKRPVVNDGSAHKIWGGRHLTVETGLTESGRHFTRNDLQLVDRERIWLITGPNMAGKSTFLRQSALISILAQTGSFVPADYVEIGLVDQIFSRIGSADNLSQDQSTFMVEMMETAYILRHATPRSFVIMDEVGRGTTPEDGVAVSYAALHHLQYTNRCRALFATHFHALADMTTNFDSLACYCTDVIEEAAGSFRYDHRVRKGVNRNSHALKVARLAGMPQSVIDVARDVLTATSQKESTYHETSNDHLKARVSAIS